MCNSILYGIFTDRSIFRHWSLWFQWDLNSPQIQSTHAGDTFQARIGIWKGWFLRRGENGSTWRKTSRSREENQQQTQPTYDARSNPGHTGAILLQCLNGGRTVPRLKHQKRSKVIAIPVLSRNHSFTPYTVSACRSNTSTAYSAVITF